jgi:hypothetical protein
MSRPLVIKFRKRNDDHWWPTRADKYCRNDQYTEEALEKGESEHRFTANGQQIVDRYIKDPIMKATISYLDYYKTSGGAWFRYETITGEVKIIYSFSISEMDYMIKNLPAGDSIRTISGEWGWVRKGSSLSAKYLGPANV